ncbi:hypothetical protein BDZ45DRAFT_742454 [Acephala macrosclerotiorum]|nr:hypothetical protein BDZ45DRAFT_742454 [Acephala macrosclerotiorum]
MKSSFLNVALAALGIFFNLFQFAGGGPRVTNKSQWDCRRQQISSLFQKYELGHLPPKPSILTANLTSTTSPSTYNFNINVTESNKSISLSASIIYPISGQAPYPAVIAYGAPSVPIPSTIAVSRIIDTLESLPISQTKINTSCLGMTGCSRNGKGALVAGAFEPRIALTIQQESGLGGDACWWLSDFEQASGNIVQTSSEIVSENVWFSIEFDNFAQYKPDLLPFDHHILAGLIAPITMLPIENTA